MVAWGNRCPGPGSWCTGGESGETTKRCCRAGHSPRVLALCFRIRPVSRRQSIRAHSMENRAKDFLKASFDQLHRRPTGISGWVPNSACFGSMACRAVPWEPPAGQHLPSSDIRSLQGARDGRLWIGTYGGLASWKDGKLTRYPELDGQIIEALLEDREGTIWVAGWSLPAGRLCRIQSGNTQCYGEDGRFGAGVTPLYEDSGGNLWAGAMNGLWRWKPGPPQLYPMPDPAQRIYALIESDDGGILIAKHSGITKLRNEKTEAYPLPAGLPVPTPQAASGSQWWPVDRRPTWTAGCCISTRGERIGLPKPKACQANPLVLSLRIGKAIFGWRP